LLQETKKELVSLWIHLSNKKSNWYIASDGSHKGNKGAYAWALSDGDITLVSGIGIAPGNPTSVYVGSHKWNFACSISGGIKRRRNLDKEKFVDVPFEANYDEC